MNPAVLLLSFSPWIIFGILAGMESIQIRIALLIALVAAVVVTYSDLKQRYILPWVTLVFFILVSFIVIILQVDLIVPYLGILSNSVLTGIAFGSLAVGMPFTLQYAKKEVPEEWWEEPLFIRINQELTAFWGFLFLISLIISVYKFIHHGSLGFIGDSALWFVLLSGVVVTVFYPDYKIKKVIREESPD